MDPTVLATAAGVLGWLSGFVGSFLATRSEIRTELRWLRRDVDELRRDVDQIQGFRSQGAL